MPNTTFIRATLIRGLSWTQQFTLTADGVDLSEAVVSAEIRVDPMGALVASPVVSVDSSTIGTAECTVSVPGEMTAALPDRCTMDVIGGVPAAGIDQELLLRVEFQVTRTFNAQT